MIGWINLSVEAFIRDCFGDEAWAATVAKPGHKVIRSGAELLGVTPAQALEAYGRYFVTYVYRQGYEKLLLCLGDSLPELLENLNNLHLHLSMALPAMHAPAFRCCNVTPTSCELHYTSKRPALWPIVKGVVEACATTMFKHEASMELIASREAGTSDHEVFRVTYPAVQRARDADAAEAAALESVMGLSPAQFFRLHPFHVIIDANCRVLQRGVALAQLFPDTLTVGSAMRDTFALRHPHVAFDFAAMAQESTSSFLFAAHRGGLELKGQLVPVDAPPGAPPGGALLFLASPRLASLDDVRRQGLFLSDIPLHDMGSDYVLLAEQRAADADLKDRFEANVRELQATSAQLAREQARSSALLYQILPRAVANRLLAGERVEAVEYPELSILFSDIVGFSTLCQQCTPAEVGAFLNELYSRFDAVCEQPRFKEAGVYKLGSVGDAYLLVCNLEKACDDHVDVTLAFAHAMHAAAAEVFAVGKPLRIRVGIHTGAAVGGIVGKERPQFVLVSDAVNCASRMESHGVQGMTHLSCAAYERLRRPEESGARFRGSIAVKGLGQMETYLSVGPDASDEARAALEEVLQEGAARNSAVAARTSLGARPYVPRDTDAYAAGERAAPAGADASAHQVTSDQVASV